MDWTKLRHGLKFIGLRESLRAMRYARWRDRVERRYRPPAANEERATPGPLIEAERTSSGAVFSFEKLRLEARFLAPDFVALFWGNDPAPTYAARLEGWEAPDLLLTQSEVGWKLASDRLALLVSQNGAVRVLDPEGRVLRQDDPPERRGARWQQRGRLEPGAAIYGLGERAAGLNLRPGTYRLWNRDPGGSYARGSDPIYLTMPTYLCLQSAGCYLVFYDNPSDGHFTFDEDAQLSFDSGPLSLYLAFGTPETVLRRFTRLVGRSPLPPRWALSYHQSRWGYRDERRVREVAAGFIERNLPLAAIHLDIDYMRGYRVFTVDSGRFPDLKALASDLERQGIRLVTILNPGVKRDPQYDVYVEGLEQDVFCRLPDGKVLHAPVWPGWVAFPDFTKAEVRTWWAAYYDRLLDAGIAGIWHDMNEPAAFAAWGDPSLPKATRHALDGRGVDHLEAHNLYGLAMNQAGYEALQELAPDRRPFLLSRSGWAGLQRHAWHWTGDNESTWEGLQQTIPTVLGLGLSGIPFTGPDIGGFSGAPSRELFLRWFQLAAFLPFFRTHCAFDQPPREPWAFGEGAVAVVRRMLSLRAQLLPYLYTLSHEATLSGAPLARPTFWSAPEDRGTWTQEDCFLLGTDLLVAPVLEEGASSRPVRLPPGAWYDFWTDERHPGAQIIEVDAPLDQIPLFVRAGAVLPLSEEGALHLHLYAPEAHSGSGRLYSDDGDGFQPGRLDRFSLEKTENGHQLRREAEGDYAFPYDAVGIHLHGFPTARIAADGMPLGPGPLYFTSPPFARLDIET